MYINHLLTHLVIVFIYILIVLAFMLSYDPSEVLSAPLVYYFYKSCMFLHPIINSELNLPLLSIVFYHAVYLIRMFTPETYRRLHLLYSICQTIYTLLIYPLR